MNMTTRNTTNKMSIKPRMDPPTMAAKFFVPSGSDSDEKKNSESLCLSVWQSETVFRCFVFVSF
jgi:hypothetical protein